MNEISSIKQAIVMLGEKGIRQFLSVIILAELSSDKPDELIKNSIVRAKVCEGLGRLGTSKTDPSVLFTLGLFSLIDAILDSSMENVLKKLPLAEKIKAALLKREGEFADYLRLAVCYEMGEWDMASKIASSLGIMEEKLPACYLDAVGWADAFSTS
jgi:EAL and modified HD-GYP domain-containing signal transduction protein